MTRRKKQVKYSFVSPFLDLFWDHTIFMFLKLFKTVTVDPKPLPKRFKTVAFLQNPDCFLAVRSVAVPWIDHERPFHI
jgi:hypothetical protein